MSYDGPLLELIRSGTELFPGGAYLWFRHGPGGHGCGVRHQLSCDDVVLARPPGPLQAEPWCDGDPDGFHDPWRLVCVLYDAP